MDGVPAYVIQSNQHQFQTAHCNLSECLVEPAFSLIGSSKCMLIKLLDEPGWETTYSGGRSSVSGDSAHLVSLIPASQCEAQQRRHLTECLPHQATAVQEQHILSQLAPRQVATLALTRLVRGVVSTRIWDT